MPKIVEKHFFWWIEQIILCKNIYLAHFKIVQSFPDLVRCARLSNFRQKFKFPKIAYNCGETLLLMNGTNNFAKNYFPSTF